MMFVKKYPTSDTTGSEPLELEAELQDQPVSDTVPCPPPDWDDLEMSNLVVANTE